MPHHLIRKLDRYAGLSADDKEMLQRLVCDVAWVASDHDLIDEAPRSGRSA